MNKTDKVRKNESTTAATVRSGQLKGWMVGLTVLAMLAFWGGFAYAVWVRDMELVMIFVTIIAVAAAVFGTIHILSKLFKDISKS